MSAREQVTVDRADLEAVWCAAADRCNAGLLPSEHEALDALRAALDAAPEPEPKLADEVAGVWAAISSSRYAVEHDDEVSPVKAVEYVVAQWNLACDEDWERVRAVTDKADQEEADRA